MASEIDRFIARKHDRVFEKTRQSDHKLHYLTHTIYYLNNNAVSANSLN
jgi:hypothetical protein